jgi:PAS domain S-box-containing protein
MAFVAYRASDYSEAFESEKEPGSACGQLCYIWVDLLGCILDSDDNAHRFFGYRQREMKGRHISSLIPSLAETQLVEGNCINPRLAYRSRCAVPFQIVDHDGRRTLCDLFINRVRLASGPALALICVPLQH